jgi:hypothetical protein
MESNAVDIVSEALISQYSSGNLIPIIGCEMLPVIGMAERDMNIHDYIIYKQFRATAENPQPPGNFHELQLIYEQFNQNDIIGFLNRISENHKDLTLLDKLSRLEKFQVFIMASMFKDFEIKLRQKNPDHDFEILQNDNLKSSRLSNVDFTNGRRKLIYLFGREDVPMFAINDEDRLEYLFSLAKTSELENSLLKFLSYKTLLFLGCDFSDWFMRYCIRVLYNLPYEKGPRVYIVNDSSLPPNYQQLFFRKHKINLIHHFPVKDFINELYEKAVEHQPFRDAFNGKKAFICYSKYDRDKACYINKCLNSRGLDTYFDEKDKEVGAHKQKLQAQIMDAATTVVMVCIISEKLIREVKEAAFSYVRDVEWPAAWIRIKAAKMRNEADKFGVIPYFVDDHTTYQAQLPEFIQEFFRFGESQGGCDELFEKIKKFLEP